MIFARGSLMADRLGRLIAVFHRLACAGCVGGWWRVRRAALILVLSATMLAGCKIDLYTSLSEEEANAILAILLENGIKANKLLVDEGSVTVQIEETDMLPAINLLKQAGYPKKTRDSLGSVFQKTSIMSSPFEERVRFIYALSQELSETLAQIDGVLTARVHIVLPKEHEVGEALVPSSAAVFVKHRSGVDLDFYSPQIKRLVSNAIEGVSYEKVSIVLVEADEVMHAVMPADMPTVDTFLGLRIFTEDQGAFRIVGFSAAAAILLLILVNIAIVVAFLRARRTRGGRKLPAQEFEPA
jgi:type III secretion protein J